MKKEEIFEMTKHINEEYILEAAPVTKKNIKLKKRIITFTVAAAIAASLSVGAFAAYKAFNKKSAGKFYDSSTVETIEKRGFGVGKTIENGHFRATLETAVKDDVDLRAVFTLETLDDEAKEFMEKYGSCDAPKFSLFYSDTGEAFKDEPSVYKSREDILKEISGEKVDLTNLSLALSINYKWLKYDPSRPITVKIGNLTKTVSNRTVNDDGTYTDNEIKPDAKYEKLFEGLEFKLEGFEKVKSDEFYNENGVRMYVSEMSIAVHPTYMDSGEDLVFEGDSNQPDEIEVHFKDGTVKNTHKDNMFYAHPCYGDEDSETDVYELNTFINVDSIDHIVFDGKTYKRK